MERILTVSAVGPSLVIPAFAQQVPNARADWTSGVRVFVPDDYSSPATRDFGVGMEWLLARDDLPLRSH
jgi:hypothetical protein